MARHNEYMLANSRTLRKCQTEEERKMWYEFLSKRPCGYKFRRQQILGSFIVDFYCPEKRLVIELDGSQHYSDEGETKDIARDKALSARGVTVLRFTNIEVNRKFRDCCEEVLKFLGC